MAVHDPTSAFTRGAGHRNGARWDDAATNGARSNGVAALPRRGDPGLGALLRLISDGVAVFDREGRVLFANQTAAAALGFPDVPALRAVTPEALAERYLVEDGAATAALLAFPGAGTLRGEIEPDRVLRFRDPNGGWDRWVLVRTRPFAEEGARVIAVLHVLVDITEERRREGSARFLEEASSRLAQSLAADRVLEHAAVSAVPRLGDECVIAAREPGGNFVPVAAYMPGATNPHAHLDLLAAFAPLLEQVEQGGRALLVAPSSDGLGALGSVVLAPIAQNGEILGTLILAMAVDTARAHHPGDLTLAEHFGARVAAALLNAERLESEKRRRQQSEQTELSARRVAEDLGAVLAHLSGLGHELRGHIGPLLSATDVLKGSATGSQRHLCEMLERRTLRLRAVVEALCETSTAGLARASSDEGVASAAAVKSRGDAGHSNGRQVPPV